MAVIGRGFETFQLEGLCKNLEDVIPKLTAAQLEHLIMFHRYDQHIWAWQDATIHDAHAQAWWEARTTA